jgi:uncharacterized membrane protein YgcG
VAALVEFGCDTAIKAEDGETGEQIAEKMGSAAVLDVLRAAAAAREEVRRLIARQAFGAVAPLLARMLRNSPADPGLLAWQAEVAAAQAEAEAAAVRRMRRRCLRSWRQRGVLVGVCGSRSRRRRRENSGGGRRLRRLRRQWQQGRAEAGAEAGAGATAGDADGSGGGGGGGSRGGRGPRGDGPASGE